MQAYINGNRHTNARLRTMRKQKKGEMIMAYTYALYTEPERDNDLADWFDCLDDAVSAARDAIFNEGINPENVAIMKFSDTSDDCQWDSCICFDAQGGAWADDWAAREEMGIIQ